MQVTTMDKPAPRYFQNIEKRPLKRLDGLPRYEHEVKKEIPLMPEAPEAPEAPETVQEPVVPELEARPKEVVPSPQPILPVPPSLGPELPLTSEEIKVGLKQKITSSFRWLAEWCLRQIKLFGKPEVTLLEVILPKDNEIEIAAAEQMFASFSNLFKKTIFPFFGRTLGLSFEIVAEPDLIRFIVVCPKNWQDFVERQVNGAYPAAEINEVPEYKIFNKEGVVSFAQLKTTGQPYYPIQNYENLEVDTLSAITSAASKFKENEAAAVQVLIVPASDKWRRRGQRFVQTAQAPGDPEKPKIPVDPKVIEGISEKITKVGFNVTIRLVAVAKDKFASQSNLQNLIGSFDQFSLPHLASFRLQKVFFKKGFVRGFLYRSFPKFRRGSVLNISELATIYHFPNKNIETPHIKWLLSKKSEAPQGLPGEGLYLGISLFRGVEKKVHLRDDDRRRHMYVIGQTGTGKSEFLKFLAQQDIAEGRGLAFIDPHGEAVMDLLKMIPQERAEDVIYFNPSDFERPMGLNILEAKTEEGKHMAINAFIALLYKLYDPQHSGIMGPRLERAIRNVMLTAMAEPENTMIEVYRLLTDPDFAKEKLPLVKDPIVKSYWTDELAKTSDFHKSETLGYFVSKFDRFITEKVMRNIVGQGKSSFDFRKLMDEGKILLVNLSKGKIGEENSNFLGLLLVPRILVAAMSRVDVPEADRRDFYLYVDEFQNFATDDFAEILAEARKYRLNLTVANQYIGQIPDTIKDAIFGNVGSLISFRIGVDDAAYLKTRFEPTFTESDLQNLIVGSSYLRLLVSGQPTQPFSMKTDWEQICALPKNEQLAQKIIELSRLRYGRDKDIVEVEIKTRAKLE
ncbi:MAG: type IV secretory system conjugative DNA transfer family protein [Candidatus Cloacimonetes bacterium]|nr:type IV secretory system conjugative DNA transfer family protein [Candidatus Cloacimonadota bacterium]